MSTVVACGRLAPYDPQGGLCTGASSRPSGNRPGESHLVDHPSKPAFTPISPNPFIVGNPVRDRKMFFGREAEFELVRKRFTHTEAKGGLLVFCGERRSGKTSILFQILDGRLGSDFIPVLIDMQSMAIENEPDFLEKIAREIARELGSDPKRGAEILGGSNPVAAFHRFVETILKEYPDRKLILLFDEYELFENKIDSSVLTEDTLYILSNLMENHSVFLIFTGSLSLENRRRDYWKIFLGKSLYRQISYLEAADARRLITEPVRGLVEYEPGVVDAIYRLTSGQAFYTQAVCQNLVDLLNEQRTHTATLEMVEEVVAGIVSNPFPQMIFLWEGLDDREKLVLALAAEALADGNAFAGAQNLLRKIAESRYPLGLDHAAVSTSLEKLFKQEMLLKDTEHPPGYAYRMDLWRRWVRRMHSVWQVMREIGMEIRPARRSRLPVTLGVVAGAAAVVLIGLFGPWRPSRPSGEGGGNLSPGTSVFVSVQATPREAVIYRNGRSVGLGTYQEPTPIGTQTFRLAASGFAESTFVLTLAAGDDSVRKTIVLNALLGNATVRSNPPGAEILVDGSSRGKSPVTVSGLRVPDTHTVEARLDGYQAVTASFSVRADTSVAVELPPMVQMSASVAVTTSPPGATITLDGKPAGTSPRPVSVSPGMHRFRVRLANYAGVDTALDVPAEGAQLNLVLREEPPGFLEIRGDSLARMTVDDQVIASNYIQNSGRNAMKAGRHAISVQLRSGTVISDSVTVNSGEHVVYDYIERRVVSRRHVNR